MAGVLVLNPLERLVYSKSLTKDYLNYIKKLPTKTPKQLMDVIYLGRKAWFDVLSTDDLKFFNEMFDRLNSELDIDLQWEVSVGNQQRASNVFNGFIKKMRSRKSSLSATEALSEEFNRVFKTGTDHQNFISNISKNVQLRGVAKRVLKELLRLGYQF